MAKLNTIFACVFLITALLSAANAWVWVEPFSLADCSDAALVPGDGLGFMLKATLECQPTTQNMFGFQAEQTSVSNMNINIFQFPVGTSGVAGTYCPAVATWTPTYITNNNTLCQPISGIAAYYTPNWHTYARVAIVSPPALYLPRTPWGQPKSIVRISTWDHACTVITGYYYFKSYYTYVIPGSTYQVSYFCNNGTFTQTTCEDYYCHTRLPDFGTVCDAGGLIWNQQTAACV